MNRTYRSSDRGQVTEAEGIQDGMDGLCSDESPSGLHYRYPIRSRVQSLADRLVGSTAVFELGRRGRCGDERIDGRIKAFRKAEPQRLLAAGKCREEIGRVAEVGGMYL